MFNYMQFNSCPKSSEYDDIARAVWEYMLVWHTKSEPPTDFGSLVKSIAESNEEKSRVLLE